MIRDDDPPKDDAPKVVRLRTEGGDGPSIPTPTITVNRRRYTVEKCKHRGPYLVDTKLACVECQDCGALLNPMFVLEMIAYSEAYYSARMRDLREYLARINKEIEGRQRTKCVHCNNMTPIRFTAEQPRTWVHPPDGY